MNARIAVSLLFLSLFATPSRAQSSTQQQPAPPAPAAAPNAQAPADAKPTAPPAKPTTADGKPAPKPAKKVWTDEDMNSLNGPPYESDPSSARRSNSYRPQNNSAAGNATYYRNQINSLRTKIADIDQKIDNYQALAHGEAPGEGQKLYGERVGDSNANVQALQRQKEALQKQISDLEDQARHAGVEPGQLR